MSEIIKDYTEEELHNIIGSLTALCELFNKIGNHAPTEYYVDDDCFIPVFVLSAIPGQAVRIITVEEACRILPCYDKEDEVIDEIEDNLLLSYDNRHVITLGEEKYLIGPAILAAVDEDWNYVLIDSLDIHKAREWITERTVTLCADGKELSAIRLF